MTHNSPLPLQLEGPTTGCCLAIDEVPQVEESPKLALRMEQVGQEEGSMVWKTSLLSQHCVKTPVTKDVKNFSWLARCLSPANGVVARAFQVARPGEVFKDAS